MNLSKLWEGAKNRELYSLFFGDLNEKEVHKQREYV